jgi:hypothetical protein
MKRIIHHIRKQPEEIKRHILRILILCFAIILFFLWIYSLGKTLTSTDTEAKINQDLKPFSALKANLIDGYNSISGSQ